MNSNDTRAERRKRYNTCKQWQINDLLENQQWAFGIVFGVIIAFLLTIGIIAKNKPPTASLIAIAATWFVTVVVPILIVHGIATYNCYPLLKYDTVDECREACNYWLCFIECIEQAKTEKDREWCDKYCLQRYQSCINRCKQAFKTIGSWY